MERAFLTILNMSLRGAVVIAVVLVARLLLCRAPKKFSYFLWIIVLIRLICPVTFDSTVSLIGWLGVPRIGWQYAEGQRPSSGEGAPSGGVMSGAGYAEDYPAHREEQEAGDGASMYRGEDGEKAPIREEVYRPAEITARPEAPVRELAFLSEKTLLRGGVILWIAGVLGMLGYSLFHSLQFRRALRKGDFSTPFVYGILRPRIYLPQGLDECEREYITLHEQIHIRRLDQVWRMLGFLALCVHWFNPLVWIAFFLSGKDMEMSCDEAVIGRLGEERIKDYSGSLLELAAGRHVLKGAPLAFGEGDTGSRIRNLLRYRRPAVMVRILAAALCVVAVFVLLSDPAKTAPGEDGSTGTGDTDAADQAAAGQKGEDIDPYPEAAGLPAGHEVLRIFEDEGAVFRVCSDGIFRADGEGMTRVWAGELSSDMEFKRYGDRICWLTDEVSNGIAWADTKSGESGIVSLDEFFPFLKDRDSYLLSSVDLSDGFLRMDGENGPEWKGISCRLPLPSRDVALRAAELDGNGGGSADEKETFRNVGRILSSYLRDQPGTLIDVSIRTREDTYLILDLDGDGELEEIHLNPGMPYLEKSRGGFEQYSLTVSGADGRTDNVVGTVSLANSLLAVSLDGSEILVAVYDAGSGGEPCSVFYRYAGDGRLEECGRIAQNVRLSRERDRIPNSLTKPTDFVGCRILSDGTIYTWERTQIFQTDEVLYTYRMNDEHKLERVKQEFYALRARQPDRKAVKLLEKLPVCENPGGKYKLHLSPGNVYFIDIAFGADGESAWIYVEGYNGAGWMEIDHTSHVTALDKENWEVFEGLSLAD